MAWFSVVGLTPASLSARPASLEGSMASESSSRSTVTNLSPALSASFSAVSKTRASSGAR